jgi:glutathione S-transferase
MYAPVVTRFRSYDVKMTGACERYCQQIMSWPEMKEWFAAAQKEPEQIDELDIEF